MPKTRIACPNCRQPIVADINQLFDVGVEPAYKQLFLSGSFNLAQCPSCGYRGNLATPIVYHDPQKELLLTYVPPELGLPRDDQERMLGAMITQVVNRLPMEQRKGYLLRPQAHLTQQGLVERVLEADGITREMIQEQQKRLMLLQRLMDIKDSTERIEILKQEGELVDMSFFNLLGRLTDAATESGDDSGLEATQRLQALQGELLEHTEFGREIKEQTVEVQAAVKSLQEVGKELTRDKLLDIIVKAPNDSRLTALVSLARTGMDYQFFQLLSERIDRAREKGRQRLIDTREKLLTMTRQYDEQVEARREAARQLLTQILKADNVSEATTQALPAIDDFFLQILKGEMEKVRGSGDLERLSKLQQVMTVLQEASAPPPEIALIEGLLDAPDEPARRKILEEHKKEITPDFLQVLANVAAQAGQAEQEPEMIEQLKVVTRQVRRFSMEMSIKG